MKTLYTILAASTSLVGAQVIVNNGTFTCPGTGAYCAGDSLKTNIIIRCDGTHGQPGNCVDNLSGYPPAHGAAECYESSPTAGDAACAKNCVVYYGDKKVTLPPAVCTPSRTESSTTCSETSTSTSTTTTTTTSEPPCTTTTSTSSEPPCTTTTSTTSTTEPPCTTTTSTPEPPCTNSTTTTTTPIYPTNSTTITHTETFTTSTATNTPIKPTTSVPPVTAAAATASFAVGALGAALLWLL